MLIRRSDARGEPHPQHHAQGRFLFKRCWHRRLTCLQPYDLFSMSMYDASLLVPWRQRHLHEYPSLIWAMVCIAMSRLTLRVEEMRHEQQISGDQLGVYTLARRNSDLPGLPQKTQPLVLDLSHPGRLPF